MYFESSRLCNGLHILLNGYARAHKALNQFRIIGQVYTVSRNYPVHKIVFMGMGEPLHNLQNIKRSIRMFTDSEGCASCLTETLR